MQTEEKEQSPITPAEVKAIRRQLGLGITLLGGSFFNRTVTFLPGLTHTALGLLKLANLPVQLAGPLPGSPDKQTGLGHPPNGTCESLLEAYGYARRLVNDRSYSFEWDSLMDLDASLLQLTLAALDGCIDELRQPAENGHPRESPPRPRRSMVRWQNTVDRVIFVHLTHYTQKYAFAIEANNFDELRLPISSAELAAVDDADGTRAASGMDHAALVVQTRRRCLVLEFARFWVALSVKALQDAQETSGAYDPKLLDPLLVFWASDEDLVTRDRWDEWPNNHFLELPRKAKKL